MTTVNLVQDFVDPFYDPDYPYSFDFTSNVLTEDESFDIENLVLSTSTFTITYRDESTYNYVAANYVANGWYDIQPVSNDIWNILIDGVIPGAVRSDFYFYSDMYTLTIIQYNQLSSSAATWDYMGSWTTDPSAFTKSSFKLLITDITK